MFDERRVVGVHWRGGVSKVGAACTTMLEVTRIEQCYSVLRTVATISAHGWPVGWCSRGSGTGPRRLSLRGLVWLLLVEIEHDPDNEFSALTGSQTVVSCSSSICDSTMLASQGKHSVGARPRMVLACRLEENVMDPKTP